MEWNVLLTEKCSILFEKLIYLVLFRFSRPSCLKRIMEGIFEIFCPSMPSGINCMIHVMHLVGVQYLDHPEIFHSRMPYFAEKFCNKHVLVETTWVQLIELCARHAIQATFKSLCLVDIKSAMESNSSPLLP